MKLAAVLSFAASAIAGEHYIALGYSRYSTGTDYMLVDDSTTHEVTCCADEFIDDVANWGNLASFESCTGVYAMRKFDGTNCIHSATYSQAVTYCANAGGRLCTKTEMLNDCSALRGCAHDYDLSWTSSDDSTPAPTPSPTSATASPTDSPTAFPTDSPTAFPTDSPTAFPTDSPTAFPTDSPTAFPTDSPTAFPTDSPTAYPTDSPTAYPTDSPTAYPTDSPTAYPTDSPTAFPTDSPTPAPTAYPTHTPLDYSTEKVCERTTCTYVDMGDSVFRTNVQSVQSGGLEPFHCAKSGTSCLCTCVNTNACTLRHFHGDDTFVDRDHCEAGN